MANKDGNTPLHHACNVDSLDVAKLLLEHGAEVGIMNKNHEFPADLAKVNLDVFILHLKVTVHRSRSTHFLKSKIENIFLSINFNICLGFSKEMSH